MAWLWLQSLVLVAWTFIIGLWLGTALGRVNRASPRSKPVVEISPSYPAYHGADVVAEEVHVVAEPELEPEPEPEQVPLPLPEPVPLAPPQKTRAILLFPVNQFGTVTVTQEPV